MDCESISVLVPFVHQAGQFLESWSLNNGVLIEGLTQTGIAEPGKMAVEWSDYLHQKGLCMKKVALKKMMALLLHILFWQGCTWHMDHSLNTPYSYIELFSIFMISYLHPL